MASESEQAHSGHLGQQWSREENAVYLLNLLYLSILSENGNGVYTPGTVHITVGIQEHMKEGRGKGGGPRGPDSQGMNGNFPVFRTASDFNTTASFTRTVLWIFPVLWARRSLGGKMGSNFRSYTHSSYSFSFSSFPTNALSCSC